MQEIEKELRRIAKTQARLSKEGQKLTEEEAKLRESLSFDNSYQSDNGEVDMQRAKDLVKNLSKHIKISLRMQMLNALKVSLEQQKRERDAKLPRVILEDDMEAESASE